MSIKPLYRILILSGLFIFTQHALADTNHAQQLLTQQYVADPYNFYPATNPKPVPSSISQCKQSLLACAERVFRYQQAGLEVLGDLNVDELDDDSKLGKSLNLVQLFIYPQPKSAKANQSDIGVVVMTENIKGDDSVAATRHRIAFVQQTDKDDQSYWKYVSHRYQWQCVRSEGGWTNKLCP